MAFDRRDNVRVEIRRIAGYAEGAVLAKPPGASGNLGDLLRIEPAQPTPVEWKQSRLSAALPQHAATAPV